LKAKWLFAWVMSLISTNQTIHHPQIGDFYWMTVSVNFLIEFNGYTTYSCNSLPVWPLHAPPSEWVFKPEPIQYTASYAWMVYIGALSLVWLKSPAGARAVYAPRSKIYARLRHFLWFSPTLQWVQNYVITGPCFISGEGPPTPIVADWVVDSSPDCSSLPLGR